MSSLKTNVVLNFINTLTGIVFPIITFPYAARVLLPQGIGAVNFQLSIINYIVLFTTLGIPMYAVKEVAKYRDDVSLRDRITVELLVLSVGLCLLGYLAVCGLAAWVPQLHARAVMFFLLSSILLFTALGVQWFYQAVEDFKFITVRGIVVRTCSAALLFLLVKGPDDLIYYAGIIVMSTVGNNVINFVHLRHFIRLRDIHWRELRVFRHLKPALRIFVLNLIISLYVNLNSVMLGFISGEKSVGMYSAGVKLSHVVLQVVTSLGFVMLPRCSNLIKNGQREEFRLVTQKGLQLILGLSLPFTAGLVLLSEPIINIFCGREFIDSTFVLCWTAPIIIFAGLTNLIGIQVLYPLDKENIVIWSTVGGAVFNLAFNCVLIPLWAERGAAVSTFVAEAAVLAVQCWLGRRYLPFSFFRREYLNYVYALLVMCVAVVGVRYVLSADWSVLLTSLLVGGAVYVLMLCWLKDSLVADIWTYLKSCLTRRG